MSGDGRGIAESVMPRRKLPFESKAQLACCAPAGQSAERTRFHDTEKTRDAGANDATAESQCLVARDRRPLVIGRRHQHLGVGEVLRDALVGRSAVIRDVGGAGREVLLARRAKYLYS